MGKDLNSAIGLQKLDNILKIFLNRAISTLYCLTNNNNKENKSKFWSVQCNTYTLHNVAPRINLSGSSCCVEMFAELFL